MNIIMLGAQGTGKGTVAGILKDKLNIPHISTGEMFRKNIKEGTELGKIAEGLINAGNLVPDDITIKMVENRINEADAKNGFILDGFPRTLHQAECLEGILSELNIKIDFVIDIEVSTEKLLERLSGRRVCKDCGASFHVVLNKPRVENICDECGGQLYTRKDDNVESVAVRLKTYQAQTKPLIEYYKNKGILVEINGQQDINDVFKEIVSKLGE